VKNGIVAFFSRFVGAVLTVFLQFSSEAEISVSVSEAENKLFISIT
jgi:hypothetical protein